MALISGHGGYMTIGGTRMEVKDWTLNRQGRLVETTNSGSGGRVVRKKILDDDQFTVNLQVDDTQLPDTDMSLAPGDEGTMVLYIGDSGKFYSFPYIVETFQPKSDSNTASVVEGTVTGYANGTVTEPVT